MQPFRRIFAQVLSALALLQLTPAVVAQTASSSSLSGIWQGVAKVRDTEIPITIRIATNGSEVQAAFLNGPADHPDVSPASSVKLEGNHLVASFDYFARTFDATLDGDSLAGAYGAAQPNKHAAPATTFTAKRVEKQSDPAAAANAPDIFGSWEIATTSNKVRKPGNFAWMRPPEDPR